MSKPVNDMDIPPANGFVDGDFSTSSAEFVEKFDTENSTQPAADDEATAVSQTRASPSSASSYIPYTQSSPATFSQSPSMFSSENKNNEMKDQEEEEVPADNWNESMNEDITDDEDEDITDDEDEDITDDEDEEISQAKDEVKADEEEKNAGAAGGEVQPPVKKSVIEGLRKGYKIKKVCQSEYKNGQQYYVVEWDASNFFEKVPSEVVKKEAPLLLIEYYEKYHKYCELSDD